MNKKSKNIDQYEIDRALLILTDTIKRIGDYLNCYVDDTRDDLFYKMSSARKEIDEIADDARTLFQECLERCLVKQTEIPKTSIKWERDQYDNLRRLGTYLNRPPCEICGETRKVEFCHIIPRQLGGSNRETNILYLCSTHHSCFDKGVLSKNEWESIDWKGKSELAKSFVNEVFLLRQEDYWKGGKVSADITYHNYKILCGWIEKHLEFDSLDEWNKKRKTKIFIRNGKSKIG